MIVVNIHVIVVSLEIVIKCFFYVNILAISICFAAPSSNGLMSIY